ISAVLLVGGSTAIPLVHKLLSEVFGESKLRRDINPMECVALGAAIRANAFDISKPDAVAKEQAGIHPVTAMDLGIAEADDVFVTVIPKYTPYPLQRPRSVVVYPTNKIMLRVPIYEGLDAKASLNALQGIVEFPLPKGFDESQGVELSFAYDESRALTVSVK